MPYWSSAAQGKVSNELYPRLRCRLVTSESLRGLPMKRSSRSSRRFGEWGMSRVARCWRAVSRRPIYRILVTLMGVGTVTVVGFSLTARPAFSAQDKHYLAVIHDPCAHSEVLDTTSCRSWGQADWKWPNDKTLVGEAHEICAAESDPQVDGDTPANFPVSVPTIGGMLIRARHPNYLDLQVGLQEVAARNIYCPDVLKP